MITSWDDPRSSLSLPSEKVFRSLLTDLRCGGEGSDGHGNLGSQKDKRESFEKIKEEGFCSWRRWTVTGWYREHRCTWGIFIYGAIYRASSPACVWSSYSGAPRISFIFEGLTRA